MGAYYNEIDRFAAEWLRQLIREGRIAPGDVDERDIRDVAPDDLVGYTQCHFFAGIGVWSYALRSAGWGDDEPVWTGSCPCQPFSAAGRRGGTADERHLWPAFFHLIEGCRPPVVFGEQVASKDGLAWLDLVQADLEGAGYTCWPFDLCAAGVGAPHIRQRLYFVAHATGERRNGREDSTGTRGWSRAEDGSIPGKLADTAGVRCSQRGATEGAPLQGERPFGAGEHAEPGHAGKLQGRPEGLCGTGDRLGYSPGSRSEARIPEQDARQKGGAEVPDNRVRGRSRESNPFAGVLAGYWGSADWLWCRDQKYRPVEPGAFPLAHGSPARVGRLRGYGNAIVAPLAEELIRAYREVMGGL